ncbi:type IX secretion system anionic LPS delivery protein PorZ [Ulvibacter antarcticus]|uniref:Putative secreted protein (Por secretion system target) n=1 Tax=Ulvibacter antarcticus TaxID=442714 RepID=A0A3L9Z2C7_9FLAO|nr:T9SS type A sorting domain-containing protein [Ulvibacter antarcticus]RMA66157.1 putative secreted protein (Por secretion system target) [Ulvibacter antarcticus]
MKHLVTIIMILTAATFLQAQNFEDLWTGHFSYVSVKSISQGNDKIYVASENAIFTYDLSTQEVSTISTVNGLSGELISTIYYSEANSVLVIGYENGLMEVVIDDEENILTVVDIFDKANIPPDRKNINHFNEYNNNLYISTEYGISVFDLAALEFGDTYFIGDLGGQIDISQTTVEEPYIFASTSNNGIKRALVEDDDLIDYQSWEPIVPSGGFTGVQNLNGELYVANTVNQVARMTIDGTLNNVENFPSNIVEFNSNGIYLTIATASTIKAFTAGYVQVAAVNNLPEFDYELQSGFAFNQMMYLGTTENGILAVPFGTNTAEQILPDGPLFNNSFAIDASAGQLWTAYGDVDVGYDPSPPVFKGISNLRDGAWNNITYSELFAEVGRINELVYVTINPQAPNEVYFSSYSNGLLKVDGLDVFTLFNESNGLSLPFNAAAGIRIYGSDFDRQGNLWFVQSLLKEGLIKMSPGGQFQMIDLTPIIINESEQALSDVAVSREGNVFFGSGESGLMGYNPNTNRFNRLEDGEGNGNIPLNSVRALSFDAQNRLWIGTARGLRVLFNVGGFFEPDAEIDAQPIIILEDGVPQELLFELFISDIETDGSNNKWIATSTSGVFQVSPNGQETLNRFTKSNSPLPSDVVLDITIDPFTGTVYFATLNGLVAFKGTATAPRDNLDEVYAFPNPVRPGFEGNVTIDGLTADANVKITDITGNLVFEQTSEGGSVLWDTTAFGKYKVASGVYLVLITTDDALETKVSKIMVIR